MIMGRLTAWRESLESTEAITLIADSHVPVEIHEQVRPPFSEKELSHLTLTVIGINRLNHLHISAWTNISRPTRTAWRSVHK